MIFLEIHKAEMSQEARGMDSQRCLGGPLPTARAFDIQLYLIIATEHGR